MEGDRCRGGGYRAGRDRDAAEVRRALLPTSSKVTRAEAAGLRPVCVATVFPLVYAPAYRAVFVRKRLVPGLRCLDPGICSLEAALRCGLLLVIMRSTGPSRVSGGRSSRPDRSQLIRALATTASGVPIRLRRAKKRSNGPR